MLISLCGYATSGKDAFADSLSALHGYIKMGWADPLCSLALELNPLLRVSFFRWSRLKAIVAKRGWTKAKEIPSVRKYLQWLGTDVCRKHLSEDVFVNALRPKIVEHLRAGRHVVVTNTRFPNEAKAITNMGGATVRVSRPGIGPVNDHASDAGLAFEHAIANVVNDGTLADLANAADEVHRSLTDKSPKDARMAIEHFNQLVLRGMAKACEFVLSVAAPEYAELGSFVERSDAYLERDGDDFRVMVRGEEVGQIAYEDGRMFVDVSLAK